MRNWAAQSKIYLIFTSYKLVRNGQMCRGEFSVSFNDITKKYFLYQSCCLKIFLGLALVLLWQERVDKKSSTIVIFMEDHIPESPDRSLIIGRQTFKWSLWDVVFHENNYKWNLKLKTKNHPIYVYMHFARNASCSGNFQKLSLPNIYLKSMTIRIFIIIERWGYNKGTNLRRNIFM